METIKNPVAPIVCEVQSKSPPSEIVLVDRHKSKHDNIERKPNLFNL